MARMREMTVGELFLYAHVDRRLTVARVDEIVEKVRHGGKLQIEESSFSDDGPDYTRVWLDGVEVAYAEGY